MLTGNIEDQLLIQALTRGGLKAVKLEIQSIFKITEERYRVETNSCAMKSKIDTRKVVLSLMKDSDIRSLYNSIVTDTFNNCSSEIKENLLEKMLKLYLRVRAFSTAKDIIQKHRNEKKKKPEKEKGLRKGLKTSEAKMSSASKEADC